MILMVVLVILIVVVEYTEKTISDNVPVKTNIYQDFFLIPLLGRAKSVCQVLPQFWLNVASNLEVMTLFSKMSISRS